MLGYLVYGEDVHQVIVWNLPHDSPLVRMLNIALLLNVLSTFPIQLFPAIETVEGLVFARKYCIIVKHRCGPGILVHFDF